jgi:DNA phosphorothioation-dependent restriction protein DptH
MREGAIGELLDATWADVLASHLERELAVALPGQCLRLSGVPRPILGTIAQRLLADGVPAEVYLVDRQTGPEPWRVGVHRVVERRNAEDGVVLALFPPDLQLAAGDSVDISTFREIPAEHLLGAVERALLDRLPPTIRDWPPRVRDDLTRRGWSFSESAWLTYLAAIAVDPSPSRETVGAALYALGLIPDFQLLGQPTEFAYRIGQKNLPAVRLLSDPGATPLERTLRLPLSDEVYRLRLLAFLQQDGRSPQRVEEWGQMVATDPVYREFALDRWPLAEREEPPGTVRIDIEPLKLLKRADGQLILDGTTSQKVGWQTSPPPIDVPGLTHFRVELVSSDGVIAWESPLIKRGTGALAKRSRTVKGLNDIDSGVYFFRVIALDEAGNPFPPQRPRDPEAGDHGKRTNESEDFLLLAGGPEEIEDIEPITNVSVSGYAEADLQARWTAVAQGRAMPAGVGSQDVEWQTSITSHGATATATVRFDVQRQYTVRLSQRLRLIEMDIMDSIFRPEAPGHDGGHRRIFLGTGTSPDQVIPIELPEEFRAARWAVVKGLRDQFTLRQGGMGENNRETAVVALVDLRPLATAIEEYARAYLGWLDSGDEQALRLDVVLTSIAGIGDAALVSPLHPLRLLWLLQRHELAADWVRRAGERGQASASALKIWRDSLAPLEIPALVVIGADDGYLDAGPLPGGWEAYLPPRLHDMRLAQDALRGYLGAGPGYQSAADVPPYVLADKLEMFLRQHPYVSVLTLNVVNPGDAAVVVDALVDLEGRRAPVDPDLRYEVRLISENPYAEGVGVAFFDLQNPDRQISEAAVRLVAPGRSFLYPKLTWSRHALKEFVATPADLPAHVTLVLDAFPVALRVVRVDEAERSSWVHGLIQEAPRRFVGRGRNFTWIRRPAPAACQEIPNAPGRSGLMAELLTEMGEMQAGVIAPGGETTGTTAVAALELTSADQSLLFSAHAASVWVITVDPHLGLDYFDAAGRADRPGYLLDFTPEFIATGGRRLLLTTRIQDEIVKLMGPAAAQLQIGTGQGAHLLIEALRSLSGRLALRLLSSPSQVQGALGMALARLFLEAYGLLADALILPLDAHPELAERDDDPLAPRLRGDVLVVTADPLGRTLRMLLVETKCYSGSGMSSDLRERIAAQLAGSETALRERFDPDLHDPDRLDRAIQTWRLASVLGFYLDRALRYGLIDPTLAQGLRGFMANLEAGYELSIEKMGLVFRLDGTGTVLDRENPEVPIWIVGRDSIQEIVASTLRETGPGAEEPSSPGSAADEPSGRRQTMEDKPTWGAVRTSFGRPVGRHRTAETATQDERPPLGPDVDATSDPRSNGAGTIDERSPGEGLPPGDAEAKQSVTPAVEVEAVSSPDDARLPVAKEGERLEVADPPFRGDGGVRPEGDVISINDGGGLRAGTSPSDSNASPKYTDLLGDNRPTPQFGLLGTITAEPSRRVALDLNGVNTISVFGVQGGGKSYTVGSIIEIATRVIPGLNQLSNPLGTVVFHYHQTQDYPPEFVSMGAPNDDPDQIAGLDDFGASPTAIEDLLVLTTNDTLDLRRQEFPGVRIEPIAFSSAELTVADWRFLMGATGNDAMYLKLLNEVMRQQRANLTLEVVRSGLQQAPLSEVQRGLAETRLDFASRFIDDQRSLRSLLRPGRLIVVDLRDEFIEKEQALGLFMTLLNVFSGAGMGSGADAFNKLIVFDEAHKYMGGALIGRVVEVVREMRHKGVNVIVASQDPVNVPPSIIELSSVVVLHRMNSPNWLRHIQKSLAALTGLTPNMLALLAPGEAFVWANKATDPTFTRRAVKMRMRPRATKHGGSTRTATSA